MIYLDNIYDQNLFIRVEFSISDDIYSIDKQTNRQTCSWYLDQKNVFVLKKLERFPFWDQTKIMAEYSIHTQRFVYHFHADHHLFLTWSRCHTSWTFFFETKNILKTRFLVQKSDIIFREQIWLSIWEFSIIINLLWPISFIFECSFQISYHQ